MTHYPFNLALIEPKTPDKRPARDKCPDCGATLSKWEQDWKHDGEPIPHKYMRYCPDCERAERMDDRED